MIDNGYKFGGIIKHALTYCRASQLLDSERGTGIHLSFLEFEAELNMALDLDFGRGSPNKWPFSPVGQTYHSGNLLPFTGVRNEY